MPRSKSSFWGASVRESVGPGFEESAIYSYVSYISYVSYVSYVDPGFEESAIYSFVSYLSYVSYVSYVDPGFEESTINSIGFSPSRRGMYASIYYPYKAINSIQVPHSVVFEHHGDENATVRLENATVRLANPLI